VKIAANAWRGRHPDLLQPFFELLVNVLLVVARTRDNLLL